LPSPRSADQTWGVLVRSSICCLLLVSALGCAGRDNDADFPEPGSLALGEGDPEPDAPPPVRHRDTLYRDEVDAVVDAGLGYFLQHVDVTAQLDNGRFHGFRIVALQPPEYWSGVDLEKGDVVLSVNGMPIERDMQAFAAFRSLKKADKLEVRYERGGRQRQLVMRIVDRRHKARPDAG
jgi:hypothetical protein